MERASPHLCITSIVICIQWFPAFVTTLWLKQKFVTDLPVTMCCCASTSSHCWPKTLQFLHLFFLLGHCSTRSSRSLWALSVNSNGSEWGVAERVIVYFLDLVFHNSIHLWGCRHHMFGRFTDCPICHLCCSRYKTAHLYLFKEQGGMDSQPSKCSHTFRFIMQLQCNKMR